MFLSVSRRISCSERRFRYVTRHGAFALHHRLAERVDGLSDARRGDCGWGAEGEGEGEGEGEREGEGGREGGPNGDLSSGAGSVTQRLVSHNAYGCEQRAPAALVDLPRDIEPMACHEPLVR